jgi:hypothetical protein
MKKKINAKADRKANWLCDVFFIIIDIQIVPSIIFFILICEAIGTAATPGLLCQPRLKVKMIIVEKQKEWRLAEETEVLGENLPQRHFCPSQNATWPDQGLSPVRRGGSPATKKIFFFNSGLWGYWHCGHSWPIVPASGDSKDDCGEADWQGKPKFSEKTCPSATFVHHKIPHDQTPVWTRAAAVGSRRLTAWAMARPTIMTLDPN